MNGHGTSGATIADGRHEAAREVLSLAVGAGFTLGLLFALAHFQHRTPAPPATDFADLPVAALPPPPPPPPPVARPAQAPAGGVPLAGLEIAPSTSSVKITVLPPDLDALIPATSIAPAAAIQTFQLYTNLKPQMETLADYNRVFQQSEVDRIPTVIHRPDPVVPPGVRKGATVLRVTVLLVVDTVGAVSNVRVLKPSGNPEFDAIIVASVADDWAFTPAIKKGHKVKCLLQQAVAVRWSGGSPFAL